MDACTLTDIGRALGDGQVGAGAPRSALVVPLAAAAVGPRGVVLTLATQLLLVEHAAVGVKVALAPVERHNDMAASALQGGVEQGKFYSKWTPPVGRNGRVSGAGAASLTGVGDAGARHFKRGLVQRRRRSIQAANTASLFPLLPLLFFSQGSDRFFFF